MLRQRFEVSHSHPPYRFGCGNCQAARVVALRVSQVHRTNAPEHGVVGWRFHRLHGSSDACPQLTAFFTSAAILASSAAVNSFSAKEVGHMAPSSRFAVVVEAERRVPRLELLGALEEADDLAVLGIRRHPVPGLRREGRRAGRDDRMEPLGHGAIRSRHLGDLRQHGALPVRLVARFRLQLSGALPHRRSFLVRESRGRLAALGGLLRLFCAGFLSAIAKHLRAPNESPHRSCSSPRTLPSGSVTVATRRPPPTSCAGSFTVAPAAVTSASFASMSATCQ